MLIQLSVVESRLYPSKHRTSLLKIQLFVALDMFDVRNGRGNPGSLARCMSYEQTQQQFPDEAPEFKETYSYFHEKEQGSLRPA